MDASDTTAVPNLAGPVPPAEPLPFFKAVRAARENVMALFPRAAYEEPIWTSRALFGGATIVSDPAGVKQVLLDKVAIYPKAKMEREVLGAAFGDGLLTSDGDKWRSHRRIMAPSFDHRSIVSYAPTMTETTRAHLAQWGRWEIDIADDMTRLTLQIISRTMFSSDADELGALVGDTLHRGQEALGFSFLDFVPLVGRWHLRWRLRRVKATFAKLDRAMYPLIRERSSKPHATPRDLLDRLIAARDSETGRALTEQEIRDEVVIIFLAGHETTALAMTYAWYLLSLHPREEAKLHAELDAVLGGRPPEYEDLEKLPYTRMVIEEALRLYPPAPGLSAREAADDDEILGQRIRKGAMVVVAPWVLHHHHALWDNPNRFDPERFSPAQSAGRARFAYLPFGAGPRICIGAALAMTEASLMLATIAQRYRLKLVPGQDIVLQHRVTMRPRDGIKMLIERRDRGVG